MKGSYCQCHYCKCEHGHLHCKGHGHGGGYGGCDTECQKRRVIIHDDVSGKKYCYGSMEGEYCHCDYCKCKHGYGEEGHGGKGCTKYHK